MSDDLLEFLSIVGICGAFCVATFVVVRVMLNGLSRRHHVRGRKPGEALDTAAKRILAEMKAEREATDRRREIDRACYHVLRDIHGSDPDFPAMMIELGFSVFGGVGQHNGGPTFKIDEEPK